MNLKPLLEPKSVALIGASNKEGSLGHDMIKMIKEGGYKGEVYPINPKYEEVCGIKCYPSLEAIGKPVDTAAFCVAAKRILEQADIAIKANVKSLVVFANCVVEGDTTPSLEECLIKKCIDANIPLLGHNAMGFYNNDISLRVCGFEAPDAGVVGNIAFVSQSGSVFSTIGHNDPQVKFNLMVATGTGSVTSLSDFMIYALNMPTTKVLCIYMESVRKPDKFIEALTLAKDKKIPIVLMKVGKSRLGAEFAQSHTGGLAGDDDAIQAVLDHYGVIRVSSLLEMFNTISLFSYYPNMPKKGGLVALADSGGERNLLADDAEDVGIDFAELSPKTMSDLAAIQEYGQEAANPLDPWGTGIDFDKIFEDSLVTMLSDDNAAIGVISQDLRDEYFLSEGAVSALRNTAKRSGKPVVFMTNFGGSRRSKFTAEINSFNAPVLLETNASLSAIKSYLSYRDFVYKVEESKKLTLSDDKIKLLKEKNVLLENESISVFKSLDFNVLSMFDIASLDDLEKNKNSFVYPAVLKTAEDNILHKADVGGVILNISSYESLKEAYINMSKKLGSKAIVVEQFSYDVELIFGMKTDKTFGRLVIIGAGGIYTELLNDKVILLPNASKEEIRRKLETLKTYKLLCGFRGKKEVNLDKLVELIQKFSSICDSLHEYVEEIDINPVAISGDNMVALDALIITKKK